MSEEEGLQNLELEGFGVSYDRHIMYFNFYYVDHKIKLEIFIVLKKKYEKDIKLVFIKTFDNCNFFYEDEGRGEISLLFIPGSGEDSKIWKYQRMFSKKYRTIFVDLPGIGKSDKCRDNYTIKSYANDIKELITKLNLNKVILIGHSMGGAIMLESTCQIEKQIIGLVGLDTLFPFDQSLYVQNSQEDIEKLTALYRDNPYGILKYRVLNEFLSDKFDPIDKKWILHDVEQLDIHVLISQTVELAKWNLIDVIKDIHKPIRLIISSISEEKGKNEFEKYFNDTIFVKGLKHLLMIEDFNLINQFLEDIIQSMIAKSFNT